MDRGQHGKSKLDDHVEARAKLSKDKRSSRQGKAGFKKDLPRRVSSTISEIDSEEDEVVILEGSGKISKVDSLKNSPLSPSSSCSENSNNNTEETLTESKKETNVERTRSGRIIKKTLVRIGDEDVLAINNYRVIGGQYVYNKANTQSSKKSLAKKKTISKNKIVSEAERKRKERVQYMRVKREDMEKKQGICMSKHLPLLSPFLEDKVIKRLSIIKESSNRYQKNTLNTFMQPDGIVAEMRDYQLDGLRWMTIMHEKGLPFILGDEMGLGKTIQTLSLFCYLKEEKKVTGPSLVICPLSVLYSWCNEINKFAPNLKYVKFHCSSVKDRDMLMKELKDTIYQYDVIITTYEMAKSTSIKHFWACQHFNYVVLDEGHIIKNSETDISHAVRRLHYENTAILTGTPLQNNLVELWSILNYMLPSIFTTSEPFAKAFDIGHSKVDEELLLASHNLLKLFMLRRLKNEVEKLLPPKIETRVICPLSELQVTLYKKLLMKELHTIIKAENSELPITQKQLSNLVIQLRKAVQHPFLFEGIENVKEDTPIEDLVSASGKLCVVDLLLRSLNKKKNRVVFFSQFTRVLDIVEDYCEMRGWEFCRFDGSTPRAKRNFVVNDFNLPNSKKFIFLMSTRSGGMGLNLQTADTVILHDSDWNPQSDLQAMARVHRIGQKKPVHVYRLVAGGTIEERIVERAQKKLFLDSAVNISNTAQEKGVKEPSLSTKTLLADIKFGSNAVFGDTSQHSLPSDEDIEIITDRSRTENTSMGKLKGGVSNSISDFDACTELTNHNNFEGIDFKKIREEQFAKKRSQMGSDWNWALSFKGGKRIKTSRVTLMHVHGLGSTPIAVLRSNNYNLESGESSVFDKELSGRNQKPREVYSVPKKEQKKFRSQDFCQFCGYDEDLINCPRCPCAVHLNCLGIRNKKSFLYCSHHHCSECGKSAHAAGGILFPCQSCPHSYCEDCLPEPYRVLNFCPRLEELGYDSTKRACYIHCSKQCEDVAIADLNWSLSLHESPQICPPKLDLCLGFEDDNQDIVESKTVKKIEEHNASTGKNNEQKNSVKE